MPRDGLAQVGPTVGRDHDTKESRTMRNTFIAILLVAAFVVGGGIIASVAYQVGLSTAVSTAVTESGATVVAPVVPAWGAPGYGYGWGWGGPGFGIFGFLGVLFFIFLVIALLRAAFFRGHRHGGWGAGGNGGPWERHAHDTFETWHREAHEPGAGTGSGPQPPAA
jgi:hypothetical protein